MQKHGFKKASVLLKKNIQKASESRGFAQSRVLTHWSEIVGEEIASISVPTKVSYKTDGLGATLTVLTSGSNALILEMQKEFMRNKINAVYGYNAVHKIRITQSSPIAVMKKNKISFFAFVLTLLLVVLPNVYWNFNNGWVTLSHTADNTNLQNLNLNFYEPFKFLFSQIFMLGVVLFFSFLYVIKSFHLDFENKFLLVFSL